MEEYISSAVLDINGTQIDDFKKISIREREIRKEIRLMRKTGFVRLINPSHGITVDYVIPKNRPEYDFEEVEDATLTLTYDNGATETFTGVCTLKVGEVSFDDSEEASVRPIELAASGRIRS